MVSKMKNFLKFKTEEKSHDLRKYGEEYYLREAKLWRPFRLFGVFSTVAALSFALASVLEEDWLHGKGFQTSMWSACYWSTNEKGCLTKRPYWQNAVIGMMVFALTFGTTAAVLAFCGVCTSPLPKKIYYFHSAGEIFLVSALCSCIALVIYPIAIEVDPTINNHTYGTGYGLGWGGTVFFFLASFCMSLDDLVRESSNAKCCRYCWKSSSNERTELQQV
ncbi:hypothetical protein CHS0354_018850 [Potamilus streckersoni]|uniref:Uncharacterized protein n=1 Tax=Potamilus streckersoni TaxID=2493646 RepID=A0AAE0SIF8_9BIVA|nr:hypothetical protein CHS0354_018850 [Potamilus streckersoni]